MTVTINTDHGSVEVTFYSEPGQTWGGALVYAPCLRFNDEEFTARLYFSRDGSSKPQVGTLPDDEDAYDIMTNDADPQQRRYAIGEQRQHILLVLGQAFAEATYAPEFCLARKEAKGRELAVILRQRDELNKKLDQLITDLRNLSMVNDDFGLSDLPHFARTPDEHPDDYSTVEQLRDHLLKFNLNGQTGLVKDPKVNMETLSAVHVQVCPLARRL